MAVVTAEIGAAVLAVEPGNGTTAEVRVRNTGTAESELRFEIMGDAREWGIVSPPRLTLAPQQEGTARLSFHPPRTSRSQPGPVRFQVRVVPIADPASATVVDGVIEVGPFTEVAAALGPGRTSRRRARHQLTVENRGNVPLRATIEARSTRGGLLVRASPRQVDLAPSATADVEVTARSWRPHLRPPRRAPAFQAVVRPDGGVTGTDADVTVEATLPVPPKSRTGPVLAVLVVVALVAGYLLTRDDEAPGGPTVAARNGVGMRSETFVDASRRTDPHGAVAAQPTRTLPTRVFYPASVPPGGEAVEGARPAVEQGPYPLILFVSGSSDEGMERYGELMTSLSAGGYVVAAPIFPFQSSPEDRSSDDYPNQPADMGFVAREMVRLSGDQASPLRGLVDPERIGAAGVGLGGITIMGLTANTCCQDPQFKAGAVMAANQAAFGDGEYFKASAPPLLVLHGDQDETIPYADARKTFTDATGPVFLVTMLGGGHGDPFIGPVDRPMNAVTLATTMAFFDHYLRGEAEALDRLRKAADVAEVARLEQRT